MPNFSPKKLLAFLTCFVRLVNTYATTYYISPAGNDTNSGTSISTAWKTIAKLNTVNLLPGDVVLFEGSKTFSGTINIDANDGNNPANIIKISSYGSGRATVQSGNAMGFYAFNTKGFEVSDLIFEGSGLSTNTTDGVKIHTNLGGNIKLENITIKNVEIRNYGVVGLYVYSSNYNTGFKNVLIDGVHVHDVRENGIFIKGYTASNHVGWPHQNITIRNSEANNIPGYNDPGSHRGSGIIMAQVDGGVIEKSVAHHNGMANTHCGGPGGIWAYDANNVVIQHCESYKNSSGTGCDGLGFDLDGGITNSILQYNYSHDNDGAGYLLGQYEGARLWSNNTVRYNISENDGRTNSGGITLFKGANAVMNGCKIYNNTIFTSPTMANSGVGAFTFTEWNTGITGIEVYNNIFQTTGGSYLVDIPTGYNATLAGNLYWSTGGTFKIRYHGTNYASVAAFRTASGEEKVGNVFTGITADPQLANIGGSAILWPSPTHSLNAYTYNTSPAINAGLDLTNLFAINTGSVDYFNTSLPAGNLRDIGAYEKPTVITTSLPEIVAADKEEVADIRYFPNPISGGEQMNVTGGEAPYTVQLFSINGSEVMNLKDVANSYALPSGILTSGIYVISVTDNKGKRVAGKIVVR